MKTSSKSNSQSFSNNNFKADMDSAYPKIPFIQVNGLAFPGASGSCVYHESGGFIGIIRASIGFHEGTQIGLVIPLGFIEVFLEK